MKTFRRGIRCVISVASVLVLCMVASAQDCSQWANNWRQSVVSLSVEKTRKETGALTRGSGTGFIVSREGHLLTAYHVVAGDPDTDDVKVFAAIGSLHGQQSPLQIVVTDKIKDIAVLAFLDDSRVYNPMPLGNPFDAVIGGQLCSLSFAAPLDEDYHTTTGTLSKKSGEDKKAGIKNLWTTEMPSNFGESGAPVIDLTRGGVIALKYGGRDPSAVQNVNYLIPLNLAKGMLDEYCNVKIPNLNPNETHSVEDAVLQSVNVTFVLPPGDDKDFDTSVAISITKGAMNVAANNNIASGVKFSDPGNYGPFSLSVAQPVTKSLYKNSLVTMVINPNGNDRWITSLLIEARFSDNQVVKSQFGPVVLDQDNKTILFQNP
jgi:S1-C subfamily serine protease